MLCTDFIHSLQNLRNSLVRYAHSFVYKVLRLMNKNPYGALSMKYPIFIDNGVMAFLRVLELLGFQNSFLKHFPSQVFTQFNNRDLKIRRRRVSTTADLVEGGWGEVAVAMAGKLSLRYARDGGAFSKFRKCFKNSAKGQFKDLCMFSCRLS